MPTNPIPKGTCNLPVNITVEERAVLGRLAVSQDMATGSLVRDLILAGLRQNSPVVADQVQRIRLERKRMVLSVSIAFIGIPLILFADFSQKDLRLVRCSRTGRSIRRVEEAI